jgi:hypothetical protein
VHFVIVVIFEIVSEYLISHSLDEILKIQWDPEGLTSQQSSLFVLASLPT